MSECATGTHRREGRFLRGNPLFPTKSMTTVTRIRLRSGDREALESVVGKIKRRCRRKGAEFRGPHSDTPEDFRVPLYRRLDGDPGATDDPWHYTVFQRRIELRGHEALARDILGWDFPDQVKVEAAVEQIQSG
jgi:ribosomal protein S10